MQGESEMMSSLEKQSASQSNTKNEQSANVRKLLVAWITAVHK
jgi:hypothetical protein